MQVILDGVCDAIAVQSLLMDLFVVPPVEAATAVLVLLPVKLDVILEQNCAMLKLGVGGGVGVVISVPDASEIANNSGGFSASTTGGSATSATSGLSPIAATSTNPSTNIGISASASKNLIRPCIRRSPISKVEVSLHQCSCVLAKHK